MIIAKNIIKKYKTGQEITILKDVTIEIPENKIISIYGPSGSGKTTLLNILSTLDNDYTGEIIFDGQSLTKMSKSKITNLRKKHVGFIFQKYELFPMLTAKENILVSANLSQEQIISIDDLSKKLGIYERLDHYPSELSGGQQQRVAIARALIKKPKYVFCDEPTGALDRQSSEEVMSLIQELNQQLKTTFIIVTHSPEIAQISDVIITIDSGKIVSVDERGA